MLYFMYKTTNIINNKIYIGIHKTTNLNDSYMGSGKLLIKAFKKHGKSNFIREILEFFESESEMAMKEELVVDVNFIARKDTYNIMVGGKYGTKERNGLTFLGNKHSDEVKSILREYGLNRIYSDETRLKMSQNNFSKREPKEQRLHAIKAASYVHTDIHNERISISMKNNPDIGKCNIGLVRIKVKCDYCNMEGANNTMSRWHFDNCKFAPK